jgi:aspartate-semialdehyde dehydrogenase
MLLNGALTQAGQDMVLAVLTTRAIPVVPDNTNPQDSPIEAEFKRQRDLFKVNGIGYIYSNPNCTLEEVLAAVQPLAPMISGAFLIQTYIQGAFDNGYIAEATFEAFKNFICSRTLTELMSI